MWVPRSETEGGLNGPQDREERSLKEVEEVSLREREREGEREGWRKRKTERHAVTETEHEWREGKRREWVGAGDEAESECVWVWVWVLVLLMTELMIHDCLQLYNNSTTDRPVSVPEPLVLSNPYGMATLHREDTGEWTTIALTMDNTSTDTFIQYPALHKGYV